MKFFLFLFATAHALVSKGLTQYNIAKNGVTVSGVSSGGAMATVATSACMSDPSLISITALVAALDAAYEVDSVDDPSFLKSSPVWLLTGTEDTVVVSEVVMKTVSFYQYYEANVNLTVLTGAEHAWITNDYGNPCSDLAEPYINNCGYDAAGQMLQYMYGTLNESVTANPSNLFSFSQASYIPIDMSADDIAMGPDGWLYVPTACQNGAECRMNIAFHGCEQNIALVGDKFYTYTNLNEWAENNNIIILYPQAIQTDLPYNPEGCWDWWGYTGADYASQLGFQMIAVRNMVTALTGF